MREDDYTDEDNDWDATEYSKEELGFDFDEKLSEKEEQEIKNIVENNQKTIKQQ